VPILNHGQPAIIGAELGENVAEGENSKAGHVVLENLPTVETQTLVGEAAVDHHHLRLAVLQLVHDPSLRAGYEFLLEGRVSQIEDCVPESRQPAGNQSVDCNKFLRLMEVKEEDVRAQGRWMSEQQEIGTHRVPRHWRPPASDPVKQNETNGKHKGCCQARTCYEWQVWTGLWTRGERAALMIGNENGLIPKSRSADLGLPVETLIGARVAIRVVHQLHPQTVIDAVGDILHDNVKGSVSCIDGCQGHSALQPVTAGECRKRQVSAICWLPIHCLQYHLDSVVGPHFCAGRDETSDFELCRAMLDDGRVNFWVRRWLTPAPAPRKYLVHPWVVNLDEAAADSLPWLNMLAGALARVLAGAESQHVLPLNNMQKANLSPGLFTLLNLPFLLPAPSTPWLTVPGEQVRVGVLAVLVLPKVLGRAKILGQSDPGLLDHSPELDGVEGGSASGREVRDLHQLQGEALVLWVKDGRHLGEEGMKSLSTGGVGGQRGLDEKQRQQKRRHSFGPKTSHFFTKQLHLRSEFPKNLPFFTEKLPYQAATAEVFSSSEVSTILALSLLQFHCFINFFQSQNSKL